MKTLRMTDRWVRTVSVKSDREEFCDSVTPGLRLRVSSKSHKWCVMTRRGGKQVRVQIGEFPEVALGEARRRARHVMDVKTQDAADGAVTPDTDIFPSLRTLCEDYVTQMKAKGQASHDAYHRALIRSDHSFCNYMERVLGRPARVVDVKQEHAVDWLRETFQRSPAHSRHCRAYLHAIFAWAIKANLDFTTSSSRKNYGVTVNPVAGTPTGPKATPRQRVLTKEEIRRIWEKLPDACDPRTTAVIRMVTPTARRS